MDKHTLEERVLALEVKVVLMDRLLQDILLVLGKREADLPKVG